MSFLSEVGLEDVLDLVQGFHLWLYSFPICSCIGERLFGVLSRSTEITLPFAQLIADRFMKFLHITENSLPVGLQKFIHLLIGLLECHIKCSRVLIFTLGVVAVVHLKTFIGVVVVVLLRHLILL
jgi:hypothetical protein